MAEVDKNLGLDIKKILQDQVVFIPDQYVNTLRNFLPYQKGRIENNYSGQRVESGKIHADERVVIIITGNGFKTQECVQDKISKPHVIPAKLADFKALYDNLGK